MTVPVPHRDAAGRDRQAGSGRAGRRRRHPYQPGRRHVAAVGRDRGRPPRTRSISAWSAKPTSAKSRQTRAASIGSSHSPAARPARCSWLVRKRSLSASCAASRASVTSWNSQPTPSGTGSSASGDASRTKPLRQHRRRSLPSCVRSVTHSSASARGAPSASTWWSAPSNSSTPCTTVSPRGRPSSAVRPEPSARAACPFTTVGRRSTSTRTTPHSASSNSASLSAMDRSRSICAWTSLNAQYTPAGLPSAPRTPADCVRTSTLLPSLRSSANSCTSRPGTPIADMRRPCTSSASALRTAQPANPRLPTASSADQPSIRSASRFQWVITPSASNAQSAASIPSSSAASRSAPGPPSGPVTSAAPAASASPDSGPSEPGGRVVPLREALIPGTPCRLLGHTYDHSTPG